MKKDDYFGYSIIIIGLIILGILLPYMSSHDFWTAFLSQVGGLVTIFGAGYVLKKL